MLASFSFGRFYLDKRHFRLLRLAPIMMVMQGCNPIDQRTFDPNANRPPIVHAKPDAPAAKPFIEIVQGTSPDVYKKPLEQSVKTALAHKRNILFTIDGLTPLQKTPQEQLSSQKTLLNDLVTPVAQQITEAGALPIQLDIHLGTDPSIKQGVVRINVR